MDTIGRNRQIRIEVVEDAINENNKTYSVTISDPTIPQGFISMECENKKKAEALYCIITSLCLNKEG